MNLRRAKLSSASRCVVCLVLLMLASGTLANGEPRDSRLLARLDGHELPVMSVVFDEPNRLMTCDGNGWIKRWKLGEDPTGTLLFDVGQPIRKMVVLPDKRLLVAIGVRGGAVLQLEKPQESKRFQTLDSNVISTSGKLLALKLGKSIEIHRVDKGQPTKYFGLPNSRDVECGCLASDDRFVGIRGDGQPWVWRFTSEGDAPKSSQPVAINEKLFGVIGGRITNVSIDQRGKYVAFGGFVRGSYTECGVDFWDARSLSYIRSFQFSPDGLVDSIAFSPDGTLVAISGISGLTPKPDENVPREDRFAIRLLRTADFKELSPLKGHRERVMALSFSGDGRYLASGSVDKSAIVWDVTVADE